MEREKLEKFLEYILDKIEPRYKKEVETAIEEFLKETNNEAKVQEQLSKGEAICIYRHLKAFVDKEWDKKENVPDPCINCNHHYCSEDRQVLNPWKAFYKLSQLACEPYSIQETANNQNYMEEKLKEIKEASYTNAVNHLKDLEKKSASAKTEKEKSILLNEIRFLKATIERAKDLLNH